MLVRHVERFHLIPVVCCSPSGGEVVILKDLQGDIFTCDCGVPQTDCRDHHTSQVNTGLEDATIEPRGHYTTIPLNTQQNTRSNW